MIQKLYKYGFSYLFVDWGFVVATLHTSLVSLIMTWLYHITIVDPEEHCCESVKEGSGNLESFIPEASTHGDVSGDDRTNHLSFSSSSEDESF